MDNQPYPRTRGRLPPFARRNRRGRSALVSMSAILLLMLLSGCNTTLDSMIYQATNAATQSFLDGWLTQIMNAAAGLWPFGW